MTNEHDVEIARIGAALQMLGSHDEEMSTTARAYLLRQFSEPATIRHETLPVVAAAANAGRCSKMRPGKTNMLADALRCSRALGHEGQCAFIEWAM